MKMAPFLRAEMVERHVLGGDFIMQQSSILAFWKLFFHRMLLFGFLLMATCYSKCWSLLEKQFSFMKSSDCCSV